MDIVMKVAPSYRDSAAEVVDGLLRQVLSPDDVARASLTPVFPDVTTGRRAGMMVLSLDQDTPPRSLDDVLDSLRGSEAVEYAQPAQPREPKRRPAARRRPGGGGSRRSGSR